MKVMLKDGSSMEFENGISVLEVAKTISELFFGDSISHQELLVNDKDEFITRLLNN